ncbi:MAG TPA: rhodanese-like domain-containing protein [Clostridia bacterium]|nr:rhodanese-like domain-containing protein [Clostridia bacterium]
MARFLVVLVIAIAAVGCAGGDAPASTAPASTAPDRAALPIEVDVAAAAALRDAGALMLDVREPDEWAQGHVPGATLIPLGELAARTGELPRDRDIVVICRSGNRSAQGRDILLAAGFGSVTSVGGGIAAWSAAGLPVEPGA